MIQYSSTRLCFSASGPQPRAPSAGCSALSPAILLQGCCMRSTRHLAIVLLVGACAPAAAAPARFEAEIRAFEVADRASPPPLGGVVFIGSSSIRAWGDVAADFPGVPVLNRGFGSSTLADVVYYADRILLPYRPRLVVLYAGDNDLALGRTPERVLGDYRAFVARLRAARPGVIVAFVAIKPSPARRIFIDRMRETNRLIQAEIARDSLQVYVDVFTPMLDGSGQPRPELFLADSLHMTRAGYLLWRARLAPLVR
jgi:lysophospholipase L1-like esterase